VNGFLRRATVGLLTLVGLVVVVLGAMAVIGACLPREHVAARSAVIAQPPATVWRVVAEHAAETTWRPELRAIERVGDRDGRPAWVETYGGGRRITLVDQESDAPRRLVRRVVDGEGALDGSREIVLAPDGSGTRVTLTERGVIGNPIARCAARFLVGFTRAPDAWLRALARSFGQGVEPEDAAGDAIALHGEIPVP
jgi:hypothetical protein